jgi:hypothetical protein
MKILAIVLIATLPMRALAASAYYIVKDAPSPITGYVIAPDTAARIHDMQVQLNYEQTNNEILTQEVSVLGEQTQADHKEIASLQHRSFFSHALPFMLGVVATGAVYGLVHAIR